MNEKRSNKGTITAIVIGAVGLGCLLAFSVVKMSDRFEQQRIAEEMKQKQIEEANRKEVKEIMDAMTAMTQKTAESFGSATGSLGKK